MMLLFLTLVDGTTCTKAAAPPQHRSSFAPRSERPGPSSPIRSLQVTKHVPFGMCGWSGQKESPVRSMVAINAKREGAHAHVRARQSSAFLWRCWTSRCSIRSMARSIGDGSHSVVVRHGNRPSWSAIFRPDNANAVAVSTQNGTSNRAVMLRSCLAVLGYTSRRYLCSSYREAQRIQRRVMIAETKLRTGYVGAGCMTARRVDPAELKEENG